MTGKGRKAIMEDPIKFCLGVNILENKISSLLKENIRIIIMQERENSNAIKKQKKRKKNQIQTKRLANLKKMFIMNIIMNPLFSLIKKKFQIFYKLKNFPIQVQNN